MRLGPSCVSRTTSTATSPSGLYGNFGQANYSAAKLAQLSFMNTLKIEGAKNNIHTNSLAPVAATRMTEELIPEEAQAQLGPELVTPAAIYLVSEGAPNGVIIQAQGGKFSLACIVENEKRSGIKPTPTMSPTPTRKLWTLPVLSRATCCNWALFGLHWRAPWLSRRLLQ